MRFTQLMPEAETKTETVAQVERSSRSFSGLLLWTFGALVIYVLSVGPVSFVWEKYPSTRGAIDAFYTPLRMVVYSFPPLESAIRWYLKLWGAS